jgi:hypothetical protein
MATNFEHTREILSQHNFQRSRDRFLRRYGKQLFVVHVELLLAISKSTGEPVKIKRFYVIGAENSSPSETYFREYIERNILEFHEYNPSGHDYANANVEDVEIISWRQVNRGDTYGTIRMLYGNDNECAIDMIMKSVYPHVQCQRSQRARLLEQFEKITNVKYGISCENIVQWITDNNIHSSFYAFTPGGKLIMKHVASNVRCQMVIIVNNNHCYLIEDHKICSSVGRGRSENISQSLCAPIKNFLGDDLFFQDYSHATKIIDSDGYENDIPATEAMFKRPEKLVFVDSTFPKLLSALRETIEKDIFVYRLDTKRCHESCLRTSLCRL